jgi:hypothetical protein
LWAYAGLHLAHERGFDLPLARAIAPIPLFSTFLLGLAAAAVASITVAFGFQTARRFDPTPRLLAFSVGLFAAVMVLCP